MSKKQWRWAYATHKPWAHKHAEIVESGRGYKSLPTRKRPPTATAAR